MTKLCSNCIYFSPLRVKERWAENRATLPSTAGSASLISRFNLFSGFIDPFRRSKEETYNEDPRIGLASIHLPQVHAGADVGCELCSLILETVGRRRIEDFQAANGSNSWIHIRGKPTPVETAQVGLTHLEIFVDKYYAEEAMYQGKLRLCAEPGSPAASKGIISGRPTPNQVLSSDSLDWLSRILWTCMNSHKACRRSLSGAFITECYTPLPTRLINVSHQNPRLEDTHGKVGAYVALSYCWGASQDFVTTCENVDVMRQGICLSTVPQTIRDAIHLTRKIRVQYLWVDALCIIQRESDLRDWKGEACKMGSYYENAIFTIAAVKATSAREGFLTTQPQNDVVRMINWSINKDSKRPYPDGHYAIGRDVGTFYNAVIQSRWCSRGWVVQERYLSRRIVYYAKGRIFFECRKPQTIAEDGEEIDRSGLLDDTSDERRSQLVDFSASHGVDDAKLKCWYQILEAYTLCDLTYMNDKYPGVQGMVQLMTDSVKTFPPVTAVMKYHRDNVPGPFLKPTSFKPCYRSGLWLHDLHRGLLWRAEGKKTPATSGIGAPTWSWAALSTPIVCPSFALEAVAIDFGVQAQCGCSSLIDSDQYAQELILRGKLKRVTISENERLSEQMQRRLWRKDRKILQNNFTLFKAIRDTVGSASSHNIGWGSFEGIPIPEATRNHEIECLLVSANVWLKESQQIDAAEYEPHQVHIQALDVGWSLLNEVTRREKHVTYNVLFLRAIEGLGRRYVRIGMGEITQRAWWDAGFRSEEITLV